ncbi:esterase FE4 [Stomoxys calcitrans]|uniref:esterase FE4 n=1 Tax=Stomoxys calcitrans TaxID=35570 RepID=UPI0027E33AD9|nr:esterase FE4 [Stomoxys calcitrans]
MKLAIVIILLAFLNLSLVVTFYLLKLSHIRHCPWILVNIKGQGWVLGSYDFTAWSKQRFMQFRGIPYAEAPSGPKRFKAPVPKRPWTSFFDATKYGRSCPALRSIPQPLGKGDLEDCLNLCVYTKKLNVKRPVMFYVYGGGFYNGTASDFPPNFLIEKDIVLVVPNFRIGLLGWAFTKSKELPGNMALLDLQIALVWIEQNIATFGGDPHTITIMGQSGGACMAGALMLSPLTNLNHIKRFIIMSGSVLSNWAINRNYRQQIERICGNLNCSFCSDDKYLASCLNSAGVKHILEASKNEFFSPVVDDLYGVIPKEPLALMKDFTQPISVLTGFTKHDGSFAVAIHYDEVHKTQLNVSDMRVQEFAEGLVNIINNQVRLSENVSKLLFSPQLLSSHNHKMAIPAYIDLASIEFMKYPVLLFAHHLLEKGLAPVYLYTLDYEGQHTRFGYGFSTEHYPFNGGVHHSDDNLYLFSTHSLNKRDTKVSQNMVELWTSFAITGIPKLHCGPKIVSMQDDLGPYISINQKIIIKSNVSKELTVATKDPCKHKLIRSNKRFLNFKSPKCF